ncbi:uncharacterized protein NPIL_609801 [Nephila pilipes]|uniref:Uncharacterized protein n=1 Tax=Nephila pilipes TaxID=299642 RepID=A0A8X6K1Y5_NEPPI|nr:uncharacterized protein NPIL_609801 [Nephila pilipes]
MGTLGPAYQIQPVVYTNVPPPQPANLTQPPTSMVVSITEPTNYPLPSRFTHPPPMTQSELAKHRFYSTMNVSVPSSVNTASTYCLQESNVNHPTELPPRRGASKQSDAQDRELMPPPPTNLTSSLSTNDREKEESETSAEDDGPLKKRLKGALGGIASIYGSDDSDEDEPPSPTKRK